MVIRYFIHTLRKLALLLIMAGGMLACSADRTGNAESGTHQAVFKVPESFQSRLDQVIESYLSLKDALVASNVEQAGTHAGDLLTRLRNADDPDLSEDARQQWATHRKSLIRAAETLQAAQAIEDQRVYFEDLSGMLYAAVNDFGSGQRLYKQYCPMAFNDKGAYWLSAQEEIRNPYFGDAMLTCGEVQEVMVFSEQ